MTNRRKVILDTVSDLARDFVYYERKDDCELPVGALQESIAAGEVTIDDIVERFRQELHDWGEIPRDG